MTNELIKRSENSDLALSTALAGWTNSNTDTNSDRRLDLIRDKQNAVIDFLKFTGKDASEVKPVDILNWQQELEKPKEVGGKIKILSPATIYSKVSKVSSFYKWGLATGQVSFNPVETARPKAPKAYQGDSVKALEDNQLMSLLDVIRSKPGIVGKRDYALLVIFMLSGLRRSEVIRLKWGDVQIGDILTLSVKLKGGKRKDVQLEDNAAKSALLAYVEATGRTMEDDTPIWIAHDRSGKNIDKQLSSHGFVKNLKRYAKQAGLSHFHLHQTRHTFTRIARDSGASLYELQEALNHESSETTKVYSGRLTTRKDKFSSVIARQLGLGESE